ncbi:MAG: acyltransferase domain-containing protein, partial [Pseudomonadota bacterium]
QIAFLFTGQGAQYAGMAHGLYLSQPVFRAAIDRCEQAMRGRLPMSLTALLFEQTTPLVATELVQPALFAVAYGLAQLWLAWGVQPVAMLGHSVGEITAACIAGVLDLEAAASLVIERGRLMGALPTGGAMAAVMAPVASVTRALESGGGAVVVAARNGPANTVLSGESAALDRVLAELANEGIRTHRLAVSHAFHSPLLEPMLSGFEQFTAKLPMGQASIALVSNRDGALRSQFDAAYWRAQAREPVAFADGMATLQTLGCDTFIEIGPQPVLCGMGRDCIEGGNWIASLRQGADDARSMLDAAASLWQAGAAISWKAVLPPSSGSSLALPPYPFRRTRHWLEAKKARPATVGKLFSSWAESPAFDGRMHNQTLERSSIAGLDDSAGLVHVGLHLAFLSSACEADPAGPAHAGIALTGMQFVKPLVLAQPQQLQMLMNTDGSASLHARQADRSWFCHMQAKIEAPFVAEVARLDVGLVRSACTEEVEASVFYAGLQQKGFHLGPGLRRITHLWRRGGEVLAQASGAVKHGDEDALAFGLPAALFENCAQLPAAAFPDQPHAYMLLGWDRMLRTAALATDETWIHARATLADDGLTLHAEIGLYTAGGDLLAAMEGAVFRRTQAAHLPNSKALSAWAGQLAWVESQPLQPARPLPVGSPRWALLPTDEKTAVVAHALLAAHPGIFDVAGTSLLVLVSGEAETETAVLAQVVTALRSMAGPAVLLLVTQGNWQPGEAAGDANAAGAGVWGLAQVIRAERPDLVCRCIDVSEGTNLDETLLVEMADDGLENTVAWSGGRRFVARLATLPDVPAPDIKAPEARCLVVEQAGSLDGLSWQGIHIPRAEDLKADEVLLQVAAAAPGMRDTLLVYGALPDGALGSDCSGTVLATGPGVSAWRPGDAVIAYVPHGICALGTHVVLAAGLLRRKPASLGFAAAATLPVPYLSAWHGLVQVGGIKAGETVLVHSAGSAVGLAAVAIARSVGAQVVTSASLPKHAALRSMGLEVIGDSRSTGFARNIAGRLDLAFGAFDAASKLALSGQMAAGGRVIDLTRLGHDGGIDLNRLLAEQPEQFSALFDTVCAEIESGRLPPLPHEIVPPDGAVDALRRLSLGTVIGRLCLSFEHSPDMRGTWLLTGANGGIGRMLAP